MKTTYLAAVLLSSGLLLSGSAFAQSTTTNKPEKQMTQITKQHTDGEDVTGNNNFPASSTNAKKQRTDGEDVTGNNNFSPASK